MDLDDQLPGVLIRFIIFETIAGRFETNVKSNFKCPRDEEFV